ncbi:U6 snRNA phosphodiesterase 1-like isoform X2 [Vigna umbellata]|uniref:U6 snRNA phosphodiesterase 1-like isoform X2 n=1 Tax=Vigna umbellata TaxID=87088 RepID=UPI001F5E99AF|nr:U6 snRNA phosphodiesterase 1-like isoform X2 [Vigna umbellata]
MDLLIRILNLYRQLQPLLPQLYLHPCHHLLSLSLTHRHFLICRHVRQQELGASLMSMVTMPCIFTYQFFFTVNISSPSKKELSAFLKKVSSREPNLYVVDVDVPLNVLCKNDEKLEQVALGREFHISLGRTVPIRVHQIDSVISMLKQKLQIQRQFWIDFNKWEVFVNDDHTRTFLSVEVVQGGLIEISKQIEAVNTVYRLHNLPEFYKDPRPHISLAWALGDISHSLKKVVDEEMKCAVGKSFKSIFSCKFKGIECKIGKKAYAICKIPDGQ